MKAPGEPAPEHSTEGQGGALFESRQDYLLAALVGLFALVVYAATVQRTLSFWDCGEFIACSAIFGLPHPPGSILFVLWGRLFALLPWPSDIGLRVNLVSVLFGALAVSMGYLIVVRLVRRHLFPPTAFWGRDWLVFLCGCSGALLLGFGSTVWTNATEAEVYGLTLFLFLAVLYLSVVWFDVRSSSLGARLLVLATFLSVLGLGVHMMVYLALPGLWLSVLFTNSPLRRNWRVWVAAFVTLSVVVTGIEVFLWNLSLVFLVGLWFFLAPPRWTSRASVGILIAISILLYGLFALVLPFQLALPEGAANPGGWSQFVSSFQWSTVDWFAAVLVWSVCFLGLLFSERGDKGPGAVAWRLPTCLVAAALAAFSFQAVIPARSLHNPRIDENNPDTWERMKGFLERKQYGQKSMVTRMLNRRGTWAHQLGRHPRMGFWSFFEAQYGLKSGPAEPGAASEDRRPPAFPLLLALGLWGAIALAWVRPQVGWPLFLVLLLSTLGLVVYMNFADGTRYQAFAADQAYLEVRDRDYFFSTGFALFGLSLGLGVASFLRTFLEPKSRFHRPVVIAASAVFLFSLPIKTVASNFWQLDRSRNFVSYDYAFNLLESCEPDALLFTNGDNDTFPLWGLQEAYGVRRDVRVINLSLANTNWYLHQIKDNLGVPFDLSAQEIDLLRPDARKGRIQDQVINTVFESNQGRHEIYFSASTPEGSRKYHGASLDSHLVMEGLVIRYVPEPGGRMVDRSLVLNRYLHVYRLASLRDSTLYLDEATTRIADNYSSALLLVADHFRRTGDVDSSFLAAALASRLRPTLGAPRNYMAQMAGQFDRHDVFDSMLAATSTDGQADLYYHFGLACEFSHDTVCACASYKEALSRRPGFEAAFQRCLSLQFSQHAWDSLLALLDRWILANPEDTVGPKLKAEALTFRNTTQTSPEASP